MNAKYQPETPEQTARFDAANEREEKRIAELFQLLNITDYDFTPRSGRGAFSGYDADFRAAGREYVVEAKVRSCKLDTYSGHMLQDKKVVGLLERFYRTGKVLLYINFFEDGAIIYNLSTRLTRLELKIEGHQLDFEPRELAAHTMKNTGTQMKEMAYLSYSEVLRDRIIHYSPTPC